MARFARSLTFALFAACAALPAAAKSPVPLDHFGAMMNRSHPFDNPAAGAEAGRAIPGDPRIDPDAGRDTTRPDISPFFSQPHPFDDQRAREEWLNAIPTGAPVDPAAARDISRPPVAPFLDEPFPFEMWAPPVWDTPPLPGQTVR